MGYVYKLFDYLSSFPRRDDWKILVVGTKLDLVQENTDSQCDCSLIEDVALPDSILWTIVSFTVKNVPLYLMEYLSHKTDLNCAHTEVSAKENINIEDIIGEDDLEDLKASSMQTPAYDPSAEDCATPGLQVWTPSYSDEPDRDRERGG